MLKIYMKIVIFDEDERNTLNLYFKTIFIEIKKNPCYIWTKEIVIKYKETNKELKELNITLEFKLKMFWEIKNDVQRINLY